MKKCTTCGSTSLSRATEEHVAKVGEFTLKGDLPVTVCRKCNESYMTADVMERFDLAAAQELARRGACTGESFKFLRKSVGLKATDLAALLGVAPETISRWETGKVPVDRAAFVTLAAVVGDTIARRSETLDRLHALREAPKRAARTIEIKLAG